MENQTEDDILKRWQAEEVERQTQNPRKRPRRTIEAAQNAASPWTGDFVDHPSTTTDAEEIQTMLEVLAGRPLRVRPARSKRPGYVDGVGASRRRVGAFESSPTPIDLITDEEVPD